MRTGRKASSVPEQLEGPFLSRSKHTGGILGCFFAGASTLLDDKPLLLGMTQEQRTCRPLASPHEQFTLTTGHPRCQERQSSLCALKRKTGVRSFRRISGQ